VAQPQPGIIIGPEGQPLYLNPYRGTYTASRSYGLRMQGNFARGIQTQQEARGKARNPITGQTESQQRRERFEEKYKIPQNMWRRWQRLYISKINKMSGAGGGVTIDMIAEVKALSELGYQDPAFPGIRWDQWVEIRLSTRLNDLIEYHDNRNPVPGRVDFQGRSPTWVPVRDITFAAGASAPAIELWWYH
jgi:hypothetical protein